MIKRVISAMLTVTLLYTALPISAFAASEASAVNMMADADVEICSDEDGEWRYMGSHSGSTKFRNHAVTAVLIVLGAAAAAGGAIEAAAGIELVAAIVVDELLPIVYYEQYTYYYYPDSGPYPYRERLITYYYRDEGHKDFIEETRYEGDINYTRSLVEK